MAAHPQMEHGVDITDRFDRKLAALRAHASQTAHLGDGLETRMRQWGAATAERLGMPSGRLAEAFRVIDLG